MKAFVTNMDYRPDRMVTFAENNLPFPVERVSGIENGDGALGCSLTHLGILEKQKYFPFVILEDDCKFIQPWSLVETAMSQLPPDWDALWLGGTLDTPLKRYSENLFRARRIYCTQAIIYGSQRIVDFILSNFAHSTGRKIIDVFYYRDVQEKFNCFLTYPMTTIQYGGYSDVMGRMQDELDQAWRVKCFNKYTSEVSRKNI
jgi:hypothetical protein